MPDGLLNHASPVRRVFSERIVVFSGVRALIIQGAHPLNMAAFASHTAADIDNPWPRLERTAVAMDRLYFGSDQEAEATAQRIRTMHSLVSGELSDDAGPWPAGTPYRADDPELLLWILATLADSALVYYNLFVGQLSQAQQEWFWQDYRRVGLALGLEEWQMPDSMAELEAYLDSHYHSNDLYVIEAAHHGARRLLEGPPGSLLSLPLREALRQVIVGTLPAHIRGLYGFSWDPARAVGLSVLAGYLKHLALPWMPESWRRTPAGQTLTVRSRDTSL